jgi:hypothetical protein
MHSPGWVRSAVRLAAAATVLVALVSCGHAPSPAASSSQVWAAGYYSSGNPHGKILIERRAGGTWSQMAAGP